MSATLTGRTILVISTNYGPETAELVRPVTELRAAGAEVDIAAPEAKPIQPLTFDTTPAATVDPTLTFDQIVPDRYDAVVIPGGTLNADAIRMNPTARTTVNAFAEAGKPVAAICHAPWLLVDAGLAKGKHLTSWKSIAPDLRHAGADWSDQEVVVDETGGWTLITSRSPDDLPAFIGAVTDALGTD